MKTYQQLSLEELQKLKVKIEQYLYFHKNKEWFDSVYKYYGETANSIEFEFCQEYNDEGGTDDRISTITVYDSNSKKLKFDNPEIVGTKKYSREDCVDDFYNEWKYELRFYSNITEINLKTVGILPEIYKLIEQ